LEVAAFTDREPDRKGEAKNGNGDEPIKAGFLDVLAFIIAAFQILIPYLIVFILAILLIPAIIYLISFLSGR